MYLYCQHRHCLLRIPVKYYFPVCDLLLFSRVRSFEDSIKKIKGGVGNYLGSGWQGGESHVSGRNPKHAF